MDESKPGNAPPKRPCALIVVERGVARADLAALLEREGFDVRPLAHSGQLAEASIDLVLLAGSPGSEAIATAVASLEGVVDRPAVLAVVGPAPTPSDLAVLDAAGVDAVIPASEPELVRYQVRALMRRRQPGRGVSIDPLDDVEELAGLGSWELDVATRGFACSRAVLALYGFDPQGGMPAISVLRARSHPEDLAALDAAIAAAIETGSAISIRHRVTDADGSERLLDTRGRATHSGSSMRVRGVTFEVCSAGDGRDAAQALADRDALTGLANRSQLEEILTRTCARAEHQGKHFAILHLGLDDFKRINTAFGRSFGDEALRRVAERLVASIRIGDWLSSGGPEGEPTVGRFSSDEFTILLPDVASENDSARVARRILDAIAHPVSYAGHDVRITGCIGISVGPGDSRDAGTLLSNALEAMYQAKEGGKDHFQFFSANRNHAAYTQLVLESKLRSAIENRDLTLHYQPRIDSRSRLITGFEALARWTEEELGSVSPSDFIPLAEAAGLIKSLGRWTIEQACLQAARWRRDGLDPGLVAVNVSAKHFDEPDFASWLVATLDDAGLAPEHLEIEITESCVMESGRASDVLAELREHGMKVAIDDFGTGYSSLQYLRELPIDRLKIDRSFIKDLDYDPAARRLTTAILSLAWSLGLQCVGEGVETQGQFEFLRDHGCDEIQGFWFSKAVVSEAAADLLRTQHSRLSHESDDGASADASVG